MDLRKPTEDDLQRFKECLAAEPSHVEQDADKWTAPPGEFWTFFDVEGNRCWVRIERVLRIHFQHDQAVERKKIIPLIYQGFAWLIGEARSKGYEEVIFQSTEPRLVAFCKKLFGFKAVSNQYHVRT